MKKTSEVEEKSFTSSLNICRKEWGVGGTENRPPFPGRSVVISVKDDVTVILLIGVSVLVSNVD